MSALMRVSPKTERRTESRSEASWLPQGEAARVAGLTRDSLYTAYLTEQVRRKEGSNGHGWLYSVSDALTYAAKRKGAGRDEVGEAYDRIVVWVKKHDEELRSGEARGLGRYVSPTESCDKRRVVAIVTDVFHQLIGGEPKTRHVAAELRKRGFLLTETTSRTKRTIIFGRHENIPDSYRSASYWVAVPGSSVAMVLPEPRINVESLEEAELDEQPEKQQVPVRGVNPLYDLIVEWVTEHDKDFETPGSPYGRYLKPPEDAVAEGGGRIVAVWPEAFFAFARKAHFDADRVAAMLRDRGLLLVEGHRLKKLVRVGPAGQGDFQTKWASGALRHAYCVALPEKERIRTREVEVEVREENDEFVSSEREKEKNMITQPRVAIVGGDDRVTEVAWPKGFDLRFFNGTRNGGQKEFRRLEQACAAGSIGCVVWLSRWNASGAVNKVKALGPPWVIWDRGLGQLAKALPELLAPKGIFAKKAEKQESKQTEIPPEMLFVSGVQAPSADSETSHSSAETTEPTQRKTAFERDMEERMKSPEFAEEYQRAQAEVTVTKEKAEAITETAVDEATQPSWKRHRKDGWTETEIAILQEAIQKKLGGRAIIQLFRKKLPQSKRSDSAILRTRGRLLEEYATQVYESSETVKEESSVPEVPEVVVSEASNWLSQADIARQSGLRPRFIFSGYEHGLIHRRRHEDGTWRYSLTDALAYAEKRGGVESKSKIREEVVVTPLVDTKPLTMRDELLNLREESPEWLTWWEAHDDGRDALAVCARRLGINRDRIKHARKLRGILRKWGQKAGPVTTATQEELVFESRPLTDQEQEVKDEVLKTFSVSKEKKETPVVADVEDASLIQLIRAIGLLVDSGMLGAENALTMIRNKVG